LDAIAKRGYVKSKLNEIDSAIIDYDYIINYEEKNKDNFSGLGTTYNNKAYCLVELGKYKEALPLANKALELEDKEAYIWNTRGEIYYNLQEYDKSINDMDKAISIQEYGNSYYIRGLAKIKKGNKKEACSDLDKAIQLGKDEAIEAKKANCNE